MMFREIVKYKDLLFMLTMRDIRIKYKQAVMGFLWAIFMPIIAVLAGILIKKAISVISGNPMDMAGVVSIAIKALPWTFFIMSIKFAVNSLVANSSLVTKIYFPREVLPFASVLACFFDFLVGALALTIFLIIGKIGISIYALWLPVLILFLVLFTAGLGLLLSCANLFFRDVKYLVEIILMFGIFFTPVFFDAKMFGKWEVFLLINPLGSILEAINSTVILHKMPNILWVMYAGISSILLFVLGYKIFKRAEIVFAENI